jgi:glyoxylase-like metal-dependent hydrolase (beta-lactamase superfamily II)
MSQFNRPPLVQPALAREIAPGVMVIPDQYIDLVPNIGIVIGTDAVLVVESGLGSENGQRVLQKAMEVAGSKPLLLTTTHFHPEHAFGTGAFKGHATILTNTTQADELREKGASYLNLFRGFGSDAHKALEGVELVMPDETYQGEKTVDLGGKQVVLHELTGGHTRGDQIVFLPHEQVLFTGDLVENHLFPILFDQDASANRWIEELAFMMHLSPATVVPGHGEPGTVELLQEVQDLLIFVREAVNRRIKGGQTLDLIDQEAARIIKERYQDWGNDLWIPFEIRNVYAELTGTPLKLPALQLSRTIKEREEKEP